MGSLGNFPGRQLMAGGKFLRFYYYYFQNNDKNEKYTTNLHRPRKRSGYKQNCLLLYCCSCRIYSGAQALQLTPATANSVVHYNLRLAASASTSLLPLPAWSATARLMSWTVGLVVKGGEGQNHEKGPCSYIYTNHKCSRKV